MKAALKKAGEYAATFAAVVGINYIIVWLIFNF